MSLYQRLKRLWFISGEEELSKAQRVSSWTELIQTDNVVRTPMRPATVVVDEPVTGFGENGYVNKEI